MSLTKYKQKRSFDETPEPVGGKSGRAKLHFVIQKHDASHLHYDFRLEMEGVLKSWAVPKGPSTDPKVKRLAMMVEDHPFDYRKFEGTIPEGNYGAGTVMVWDEGYYEPAETTSADKKTQDKELRHQLHKGKIKFILHGQKLNGLFALIKSHGRGENAWLLMKLEDEHASTKDILLKDKSAISSQSLAGIAKGAKSARKVSTAAPAKRATAKKKLLSGESKTKAKSSQVKDILDKAPKGKFPDKLTPMLATLVDKPVNGDEWLFEVKWDGYRTLAFVNKKSVGLKSRNGKSFNEKFYPIHKAVAAWKINAVVDGEIVVVGETGLSNFGALQNWRSEADGNLVYYLFDILWLDGKDLTGLPLHERRAVLRSIVPDNNHIRLSDDAGAGGTVFYEAARQAGLEGIIAKKANSLYHAGARTTDWLKIKTSKRHEVVIGGYTNNEGSDKQFSALLVGLYEGKTLRYIGKIGTGFTDKMQREMMKQFKPLIQKENPFNTTPDVNKPSRFRPDPPHAKVTWLEPSLVCEVSYTEMTSDGVMRHPSFEGMRVDKKAKDVVEEKEKSADEIAGGKKTRVKKSATSKLITPVKSGSRQTLLNPADETQVRKVNGHDLKFTNLSKIYWPKEKITKREMVNYYYQVAPYILPYLKDRPQSLNRFPNGITGESFYQKDVTGKVPDWVEQYLYHSADSESDKHFMVVKDEADILLMASLGCIELNPWSSRIQKPGHPDFCIIDLDPDKKKTTFNQVIEAAHVTKQILDELGVPGYAKTSGSTGIHIYIPLGAKYTYEQSKEFARVIVTLVHQQIPEFTSIERTVGNRKGKMYLDFLQNRPQATLAAPYSLRPKPGAPVSMPLLWEEVKKGLTIEQYNISNAIARIRDVGDLFKPVLGKGIDLEEIVDKFQGVNRE